jgi:hypothetical protein
MDRTTVFRFDMKTLLGTQRIEPEADGGPTHFGNFSAYDRALFERDTPMPLISNVSTAAIAAEPNS